jgi:sugar O-acyltransferase (sialic acid O-acetyltransferase NeuD family)
MKKIRNYILWGATGHAKVLRECLSHQKMRLTAVFDNNPDVKPPFTDVPLYYGEKAFSGWLKKQKNASRIGFLVAIGGDNGAARLSIQLWLKQHGLVPLIAKHPTAFVAQNAAIGEGSQILAMACVCAEVTIGKACIINSSASVDHEGILRDGVHVCPGAVLAGCVEAGPNTMVGAGAVVLPRVKIGRDAIVGAGAVVIKDVPDCAVVVGNPARVIKKKEA